MTAASPLGFAFERQLALRDLNRDVLAHNPSAARPEYVLRQHHVRQLRGCGPGHPRPLREEALQLFAMLNAHGLCPNQRDEWPGGRVIAKVGIDNVDPLAPEPAGLILIEVALFTAPNGDATTLGQN